jgi:hypothetical protein
MLVHFLSNFSWQPQKERFGAGGIFVGAGGGGGSFR